MNKRFIGGEYFYTPALFSKKKEFFLDNYLQNKYAGKEYYYSFGGYYSIIRILKTLNLRNDEKVLLPSYLCPSILIPFDRLSVKYTFYKVNRDLEIDVDDLQNRLDPTIKAVFFINYFGFPANINSDVIETLRARNVTIIEDIVQSFFSDLPLIGDFAFNSFRKFLPVDGSIIISNRDMSPSADKSCNSYLFRKVSGQWLRYLHIEYGIVPEKWYLKLFEKAEVNYYTDKPCSFDIFNRYVLSRCNIGRLCEIRRKYFKTLLSSFSKQALFKEMSDKIVPLGFPIIIEDRDRLRMQLQKRNIYCPVHWKLNSSIKKEEFAESWFVSDHILTIPIHERNTEADIEYLISAIDQSLQAQ